MAADLTGCHNPLDSCLGSEVGPVPDSEKRLSKAENIGRIGTLEDMLLEMDQEDIPIRHYFVNGLYAREMTVKAGVTLTGAIHKFGHINVLSKGSVSFADEGGLRQISAPFTYISEPGTKKAFHFSEDSVWTTFHPNPDNETDVAKLESRLVTNDINDLKALKRVSKWDL